MDDDEQPEQPGWLNLYQCARHCVSDEFLKHRQWQAVTVYDLAERYGIPLALEGEFQNKPAAEAYNDARGELHRLRIGEAEFIRLQTCELERTNAILREHGRMPCWTDVFDAGRLWCPLYGAIPLPANSPPSSTAGRLVDIIERARELLPRDWSMQASYIEEPAFAAPGWCPDSIGGEPPNAETRIARRLIGPGWMHVIQYAPYYGGGGNSGALALDQLDLPMLIDFARRAAGFGADDDMRHAIDELPDSDWLALLAIGQGFHTLRDLLEGDATTVEEPAIAAGLLAAAEERAAAADRAEAAERAAQELAAAEERAAEAEKRIEGLTEDAERGRRVQAGAERAGRATADRFAEERAAWRETAAEILGARRRPPSVLELARLAAARLHPELSDDDRARLADSRRRWLADLLAD